MAVVEGVRRAVAAVEDDYAAGQTRPLRGYALSLGLYTTVVGALAGVARRTGRRAPEVLRTNDVALMAVATHKLSRMLTKEAVTSPLRARFTRFRGPTGESEIAEEVRGGGHVTHAVGELLTCPFCMSVWIATGFSAGLVFAPRATRLTAATFAAVAGSDFLQLAYEAARKGARAAGD